MPEQFDVETFRAPALLSGPNEMEKLKQLSSFPYKFQAQWVLNAKWQSMFENNKEKLEQMWEFTAKFVDLDLNGGSRRGASGCELDEFGAHRFLEAFEETLTVRAMREKLREIDIDSNKSVSLVEYLIFRHDLDWKKLVNAAQADNGEAISAAQDAVKSALAALADSQAKRQAAREAETEATKNEAVAVANEAAAKDAEAAAHVAKAKAEAAEVTAHEAEAAAVEAEKKVQLAEDEVRATLEILEAEQSAYDKTTETLKARIIDSSLGVVSRGRAKNELAQHLEKETMPLQRARITQQAATRKMEKATKAAKAITAKAAADREQAQKDARAAAEAVVQATAAAEAATASRAEAEKSRAAAVAACEAAEAALATAQAEVQKAEEALEELKKNPGTAAGSLWWLDRELHEARKYLPTKKGGIVG